MLPGTWAELTTNNIQVLLDNVSGGVKHSIPYADGMKRDPITKKIYYVGSDDPGTIKFVVYDETSNSWSTLPHPFGNGTVMHQYDNSSIDPTNRVFRYINPDINQMREYNLDTGTWSTGPSPNFGPGSCCEASEYFSAMQATIRIRGTSLARLPNGSSQWQSLSFNGQTSYHSVMECNPIFNVCIFGGGNDTGRNFYRLNSNGTVTTLGNPPTNLESPRIELTYDPVTGLYLMLTRTGFYTYNSSTDTWVSQPITGIPAALFATDPDPNQLNSLATPIPEYGVIFWTTCESDCKVYLYKHAQKSDITPPMSPTNLKVQ
jgi:hypothetical protein